MPAAEKRIDPEAFDGLSREFPAVHLGHPAQTLQDGVAYTFEALAEYYKGRDLLLPFFIPYLSSLVAVQVSTRRQQLQRTGKNASQLLGGIWRLTAKSTSLGKHSDPGLLRSSADLC